MSEGDAVVERDPVYGSYRGMDILVPGLPTSGGITLIESLNMLESFDMPSLGWYSQALHYMNEAQKISFGDRIQLGDPSFSEIHTEKLISKDEAKERAQKIQPEKALRMNSVLSKDGKQTTHFSIVDRTGNLASWTSTIEAPFGSGITVPGYGFLLNNELTDFDEVS